jgi:phage tail-like protein
MWAPWDVAVGVDCRAYVSDRAGGRVHVFGPGGRRIATLPAVDEPPLRRPTALALGADQRLYVVEEGVKHVTIIDLASGRRIGTATRADELTAPLAGSGAAVAASAPERFAASGSVVSEPLDSGIYRCAWHRVVLSATLARGTAVRVDTFTSEAPRTAAEIAALPEDRWSTGQVDTDTRAGDWDCLVTSAEGRYLWLRLTLVGDGLSSPQLERVEAHFPRESSLRRLPAVYRADPEGGDFLDRYLSIFDTLWRDLGRRIDTMAGLFDPLAAPAEFLPWLASWIGLAFDGKWPVERRRRLLAEGVRLYGMRGTLAGLKRHIELYTGVEPRIVEHFKLRRWLFLDGARLGSNSTLWGQEVVRRLQLDERSSLGEFPLTDSGDPLRDPWRVHAHRFTVFVPIVGPEDEARRRTIEQIVELAKPAHTEGRVCFGGPGAAVGTRCLVGVDTVLGRPPSCTVEGQARLGRDSVLGLDPDEAPTPTLRIGSRSRIGSTTRID